MSCPRPNKECNEFMCGSSVNGMGYIEKNLDRDTFEKNSFN